MSHATEADRVARYLDLVEAGWQERCDALEQRLSDVRAALLEGGQNDHIRWRNALLALDPSAPTSLALRQQPVEDRAQRQHGHHDETAGHEVGIGALGAESGRRAQGQQEHPQGQTDTDEHRLEDRPTHALEATSLAGAALEYRLRLLAAEVAEALALAVPADTPEATFNGMRDAHDALLTARRALEAAHRA